MSEREDQWWDEPLNIIGGMAGDIAQRLGRAWIDYGLGRLEDIAMPPGYRPAPRQQPGLPPGQVPYTPGGPFGPIEPINIALDPSTPGASFPPPMTDIFPEGIPQMEPGYGFDPVLLPPTTGAQPMPNVPTAQPGGAVIPYNQTSTIWGSAGMACLPPGSATIQQRPSMGMRLPSRVDVPTIDRSGNVRFTTFKNMGRPLLWSGDLAASKRVRKVAAKARRAKGR